jgi:hypothetical protein
LEAVSIADWNDYLVAQAGAAGTLTGLVFVAVSINLTRVLSVPGLTGRAAESLLQLLGVLIISTSVLIPRQPAGALGTEILILGSLLWLIQTTLQIRYLTSKTGHPFCISGILILRGSSGLYWLAPGIVFSLIAGVANAWVLLVEILR